MQCKICKNKSLKTINIEDTYYYCRQCDLIFIDEDAILSPEEECLRYKQHDNNINNEGYVNMFKRFINIMVRPYLGEINKALDFGCGPGPVLATLLEKEGIEVDIYDPCFFPDKVYKGNKYDLITSTEVFEHLKEPLSVMDTLIKHLKSDGYLSIITNFHPGVEKFNDWYYHRDATHITFYNSNSFEYLIDEFPLEVVYNDNEKYFLARKY